MRRHELIALLGGAAAMTGRSCRARQNTGRPLIGVLSPLSAAMPAAHNIEALRQGLRDLGYLEGRNIAIEFRSPRATSDGCPLAADLAALEPAVIIAGSAPSTWPPQCQHAEFRS